MNGRFKGLVTATLLLWLGTSGADVLVQNPGPLADSRFTHVAVAVHDIEKSARAFADVLDLELPQIRSVTLEAPGNQRAQLKVAVLDTANFQIELNQPADGASPTQQFLLTFGQGIQHIGFVVQGLLEERVRALEENGGKLTLGGPGNQYAFLDFTQILGTTIELVQQPTQEARTTATPGAQATARGPRALANRQLTHVGFVFRDAERAVKAFANLLGVAAPELRVFRPIDYLPGSNADRDSHVKFAQLPTGGIGIEVIEPVGAPSPWADHLDSHGGNAPHHIAFRFAVDDNFDQGVRTLLAKGGRWIKGKRGFEGETGGSSPEFDFFDTLGMVIEVSGGGTPR